MKKIISIFCICIITLSAIQIAYAGVKNDKNDADIKQEISVLNEQIKQNNSELLDLKKQLNSVTVSIQKKVAKLSSNKSVITQAKVADLKTVVSIVKSSKSTIKDFKAHDLKEYISAAKTSSAKKEYEQAKENCNQAIALQEQRKQMLNSIISQLNTADQLL